MELGFHGGRVVDDDPYVYLRKAGEELYFEVQSGLSGDWVVSWLYNARICDPELDESLNPSYYPPDYIFLMRRF